MVVTEGGLEDAEPLNVADRSVAMSRSVLWAGGVRDGWERGIGSFCDFNCARRSLLFAIVLMP